MRPVEHACPNPRLRGLLARTVLLLGLCGAAAAGATTDATDLQLNAERLLLDNHWVGIAGGAGTLFSGPRSPVLRAWYDSSAYDIWLNARRLDELPADLAVTPTVSSLSAAADSVADAGGIVYLGARSGGTGSGGPAELPGLVPLSQLRLPAEGGVSPGESPVAISVTDTLPEIPLPAGLWLALGGMGLVLGAAGRRARRN